MKSIVRATLLTAMTSWSLFAVEGSYMIQAEDVPGSGHVCTGTLRVTKTGNEVYTFDRATEDGEKKQTFSGIGIREGDGISLMFQETDGKSPKCGGQEGAQVFHIEPTRLKGPYVYLGSSQVGMEIATKTR